jgi:hypothetical protein
MSVICLKLLMRLKGSSLRFDYVLDSALKQHILYQNIIEPNDLVHKHVHLHRIAFDKTDKNFKWTDLDYVRHIRSWLVYEWPM